MEAPSGHSRLAKVGGFGTFQLGNQLFTLVREGIREPSGIMPESFGDCDFHDDFTWSSVPVAAGVREIRDSSCAHNIA